MLKQIVKSLYILLCFGCLTFSLIVLINAATIEGWYFEKYEKAYNQFVVEHDRQLAVGEILHSRNTLQKAVGVLIRELEEDKAKSKILRDKYNTSESLRVLILENLKNEHPDTYREIPEFLKELEPISPETDSTPEPLLNSYDPMGLLE